VPQDRDHAFGTDARDRVHMCKRIHVSTAVVTGARGGIGSATVRAFENAGFTVHGVDADDAWPELDRLDALVCAHGISGRPHGDGPVDACTEEAWDRVLDANLKSVFLYCKRAIPLLRSAGGGAIVTVSSVLGLVGGDADFATHAYATSKAGIIGLTRAMAVTYAGDAIRCNVICPGLIETPMSARVQADERIRARLAELQPLTGDFGRPEDVAGAALYLATAPFVTGAVLPVDGGWTAR
jgi:meso-butanediol dehydrogenase/(S,S)-butanediol dehydrogenase/diacetyl reductase